MFTFKVMIEPWGHWKDGLELTRNVVRPRSVTSDRKDQSLKDFFSWRFQKYKHGKKRRYCSKPIKLGLEDVLDFQEKEDHIDNTRAIVAEKRRKVSFNLTFDAILIVDIVIKLR